MILLMRVAGVVLAVIGVLGFFGSFDADEKGHRPLELLPIFAIMLAVSVFLLVRAHQRSRRDQAVALEGRLISLGQATGVLTVAHVVAALSLTSDEAKAALTLLTRDGLAEFDVDAEGAPIYRIRKLPSPK